MRLAEGNDQGEICYGSGSSPDKLPPLVWLGAATDNRNKTGDNKYEVSDSAQGHHHRYKLLCVTMT